jgi:hypothetical protein
MAGMFQSSNTQSNPDSSDLTQAAKNQFQGQQPAMLNTKHQNTIKDIQQLQEIEKYMFNNLQSLNKSSNGDLQKSEVIKTRLNELSTMRMGLFNQLKNMYQDGQAETANSRSNLADQITMVKVIENELTNAKSELSALETERKNKKRLVELTDYEYDRYKAHKNILKVIAYGALAVLFIIMLMQQPWFPATAGVALICVVIVATLVTIGGRLLDNFGKTNYNWDEYTWGRKGCPNGTCGSGKDTETFSWSKLFSNACDDISNSYEKGKNALLGVKDKVESSGKLRAALQVEGGSGSGDSTESFSTIVHPTQPEGHENFHSLF